jgi:predicted ATPase/CheY-like chemotaxis protein
MIDVVLRVLAVDDEFPALEEIAHLLRADPRVEVVETAADGVAALRCLNRALSQRQPIDAIFLDIRMPTLDGLMMADVVSRFDRAPQIVFVTAHDDAALDSLELEATDRLLKPVRAARLAEALQRVTDSVGSVSTPAAIPAHRRPPSFLTDARPSAAARRELTSLVGRSEELAQIDRLLAETGLVTLIGSGGVGKTGVAAKAAERQSEWFPGGVYQVDVSTLQDPDLVFHRLATVLQVRDQPSLPLERVVTTHLANRRLLILLETCELHAEACAHVAATLLAAAPTVRILATSRQPLGTPDERTLTIGPLATTPDPHSTPLDASRTEALELFARRAAVAVPGFALTPSDEPTVARICHRLDGIPLAIEMAATRLRDLSVPELEAGIADPLALLTSGLRGAPPRHQSLRASIAWSYDLCEPLERQLWSHLSALHGTFDLAAAKAVCADGGPPAERIAELLAGLVSKSILVAEPHTDGPRYRLPEAARQFGSEVSLHPDEDGHVLGQDREGPRP